MTDSDTWVTVSQDTIRGDRDGLILLRIALNEALARGWSKVGIEDEDGSATVVHVERVGP